MFTRPWDSGSKVSTVALLPAKQAQLLQLHHKAELAALTKQANFRANSILSPQLQHSFFLGQHSCRAEGEDGDI